MPKVCAAVEQIVAARPRTVKNGRRSDGGRRDESVLKAVVFRAVAKRVTVLRKKVLNCFGVDEHGAEREPTHSAVGQDDDAGDFIGADLAG